MVDEEVCAGCDHLISLHFSDVRGIVRCLNTDSGTSTSGIIGLPWTQRCDCRNYISEQANIQRAKEAETEREWNEQISEIVKVAAEKLNR